MLLSSSSIQELSSATPFHHHHHYFSTTSSISILKPVHQFSFSLNYSLKSHNKLHLIPSSSSLLTDQEDYPTANQAEQPIIIKYEGGKERENGAADFSVPSTPNYVKVRDLEELPEQWRRSKVAWLCKILPSYKAPSLLRILNAQKKWVNQEDATYLVVHFLRIRENDAGFLVYKWMVQRPWHQFDFALATKLADYLGRERKFTKCRDLFDDIIKRGLVPSESTFHLLIVSYLGPSTQDCLQQACIVYNKMIQLGGYKPRLTLHNALFRELISKTGGTSKYYLKQAEFVFHSIQSCGLEVQADIYAGLIWLHSYQDEIDKERIAELRSEMREKGVEESQQLLVSVLRACTKEGDVEEAETTWRTLLNRQYINKIPSQAFVYRMEVFSKIGEPIKSLEVFRSIKKNGVDANVAAYHKIIEVMSKAKEVEIVETLMDEFIKSGMKPLLPAFIELMKMYFDLGMDGEVQSTFLRCAAECRPNRTAYDIYLESLVGSNKLEQAEEVFDEIRSNSTLGADTKAYNLMLEAYLERSQYVKAEELYDIMCEKKYDIKPYSMDKLQDILSLRRKKVKKPVSLKLDQEQREMLIGLLLGGAYIRSYNEPRSHTLHFDFNKESPVHSLLRMHVHEKMYPWLSSYSKDSDVTEEVFYQLSTIPHLYFRFFADQFWPKGKPAIPKLIHRWLSSRVLAYWYMYGGYKSPSGILLLKMKTSSSEDMKRVVNALRVKSIECKVKRKGRVFWLGFQGSNAALFWKLVEPYVLDELKELLNPDVRSCAMEPEGSHDATTMEQEEFSKEDTMNALQNKGEGDPGNYFDIAGVEGEAHEEIP